MPGILHFAKYLQEFCSVAKHVRGSLLHVLQVTGTHRETQRETNINRETQRKRDTDGEGLGSGGGGRGREGPLPSLVLCLKQYVHSAQMLHSTTASICGTELNILCFQNS